MFHKRAKFFCLCVAEDPISEKREHLFFVALWSEVLVSRGQKKEEPRMRKKGEA